MRIDGTSRTTCHYKPFVFSILTHKCSVINALTVLMPIVMASDKYRQDASYWEARLVRMGLSVENGRHTWLLYGHRVSDLDFDGKKTYPTTGIPEVITSAQAVS